MRRKVSAIGFMFHTDQVANVTWGGMKEADYVVARKLYDMPPPVWIRPVEQCGQSIPP